MAIESYEEQLERVQAAIAAVETKNQSYALGGRSMTRANLHELYEREKYLRRMIARQQRGGIPVRALTPSDG